MHEPSFKLCEADVTSRAVPALIIALAIVISCQYVLAKRFPAATRVLFRLQAVYWFIAYVLRPAYLFYAQPDRANPLADWRLMQSNYGAGLANVLSIVLFGQLCFIGAMAWASKTRLGDGRRQIARTESSSSLIPLLGILLALGWVGRVAPYFGLGGLRSALGPFATVAVCLGVVALPPASRSYRALGLVAVLSEGAWAVMFASKTPVLALLTAFTIRAAMHLSRRQLNRQLPVIGVVALVAFLAIQPLKGINTASTASSYSNSDHPALTGAAVSILQRVDLLTAATDAYYFPFKPWQSIGSYTRTMVLSIVPKGPFANSQNAGIRWTREVRAVTNPHQFLDVYLATGPIAEGEIELGKVGAGIECIELAVFTALVGAGLSSTKLPLAAASAVYAFDSTLYEKGLLGQAEASAKAIEVAVATAILLAVARTVGSEHRNHDSASKHDSPAAARILNAAGQGLVQQNAGHGQSHAN